jgi:hypothetical protein
MRNWGTVVTAFYILVVAGFSPVLELFAENIGARPLFENFTWARVASWEYWAWVALLGGGPLVLFLVSVDTSRKRLKPRRHVLVSAAAAGLALAALVFAALVSAFDAIPYPYGWPHISPWIVLAWWPSAWLVWTLVFWRLGERLFDPAQRVYRWLVAGSVLELLIALPSHVIVRRRQECTAFGETSFGVATGLAILLMSLGPGVLFLYRARMRRLSPRAESPSVPSGLE